MGKTHWTADEVEKDHLRLMRGINRSERRGRAMTIERDLDRTAEFRMAELDHLPVRQRFIEMNRVKREAHTEVFEAEAARRNEILDRPVVGYFAQIGPVCINIGGEDRQWKITKKCVFCSNFFSACVWHNWKIAYGVLRSQKVRT